MVVTATEMKRRVVCCVSTCMAAVTNLESLAINRLQLIEAQVQDFQLAEVVHAIGVKFFQVTVGKVQFLEVGQEGLGYHTSWEAAEWVVVQQ